MPPRPRRKQWPERWRGQVGAALGVACAALCGSVPTAAASSTDAQATHAYLVAQYKLARALSRDATLARGPERAEAAQIARECPGVVSGMPAERFLKPFPAPPPQVKGENARVAHQRRTIDEELVAALAAPDDSVYRAADEAYAVEVRQLSWTNPAITSTLQAATTARLEAISTAAPPFCADARAWAQSGYRILAPPSREFQAARATRRSEQDRELFLGTLLKPYENAADRALIRKTTAAENELFARAESTLQTILRLKRILGFPRAETRGPEKTIVFGRGHTAAGTRFEVTSETGLLSGQGCHRAATVAYTRPGAPETLIVGGPNNPICLSSPQYRHPALFCEAGIETIQTAVPASVRSGRLVLADGRTIESRVVRVPRRYGGPAGIYAQQIRGNTSYAASLLELNAEGAAVLTLALPRYRCVKPRNEAGILPTATALAGGNTPDGKPFTISAIGAINGEPFLSVDRGVDPELNEPPNELGTHKAFPWSVKIECAPHPYAILYGILTPPGKSVLARTPQGAVALNPVALEPLLDAKGPLVYGVFTALPSELTVLAANGSTVYTENLQAKATEATQFCEGYAEP